MTARSPLLLLLMLASCLPDVAPNEGRGVVEYGPFPEGVIPFPETDGVTGFGDVEPSYGFASGQRVELYDFGEVAVDDEGRPTLNTMYVFYDQAGRSLASLSTDGKQLEGQFPIVDSLPNRAGYSPYWELARVVVPNGYRNNRFKSADAVKRDAERTGVVVNCPVVDVDDTLEGGLTRRDEAFPRTPVWFDGLQAFCFLLDSGARAITEPDSESVLTTDLQAQDAFLPTFVFALDDPGQERSSSTPVESADNLILSALPGDAGYSPLVRVHSVVVDSDFSFGDLWSTDDVDALRMASGEQVVFPRPRQPYLNVSVRGVVPSCTLDGDCSDPDDEDPLTCNLELTPERSRGSGEERGFCDTPPVGFGRECGSGIARCDPFGGPIPPAGVEGALQDLICIGLLSRDRRFCYNACDPDGEDADEAEDRDSRCGSLRDYQCFGLSRRDKPNGVCLKRCNSLATGTLVDQCRNNTDRTDPPPAPEDVTCGNGQLDHGEACDPEDPSIPTESCNDSCTISTAESPTMQSAGAESSPAECTNAGVDVCIFPDQRAEAL